MLLSPTNFTSRGHFTPQNALGPHKFPFPRSFYPLKCSWHSQLVPHRLKKPPFSQPLTSHFTSRGTKTAIFVPARVTLNGTGNKFLGFRSPSRHTRLFPCHVCNTSVSTGMPEIIYTANAAKKSAPDGVLPATFATPVCSQVHQSSYALQTRQSFKPRGEGLDPDLFLRV